MLQWITPREALLWRRCKRLLLEDSEERGEESGALLERQGEEEQQRLVELVLSRFSGTTVEIDAEDSEIALEESARNLFSEDPPKILLRPAFSHEGLLCRPELMRYSKKQGGWTIYLVRTATGVRGAYVDEAAMHRLVARLAGVEVAAVKVLYLNKSYVRKGELDLEELLRESDLTRRAEKRRREAEALFEGARKLLSGEETVSSDYRCELPGPCSVCREELKELPKHNILTLARGGREARQLFLQGIDSILDLPEGFRPSYRQRIQLRSVRKNRLHLDREQLGEFVSRLEYPRVYLDFEAFNTAIPPMDGVSPWEHIPYLFSIHRQERAGGEVVNETFLMEPGEDYRIAMFRQLLRLAGDAGSLIVFSSAFESSMIRQLAAVANAPESGEMLIERIEDLLEPFNEFAIYHPDQLGKVSMKRIVPIFTEESYEELEVQDGLEANVSYGRLYFGEEPASGSGKPEEVLRRLKEYCIQDTSGMVRLVERLEELVAD